MTTDAPTVLERIVLPVVRALVHDDETVDEISLRPEQRARGHADLLLTIVVEQEPFRWVALLDESSPESEEHARSRLASDLQDFIAESRFGRGQLSSHPF